MSIVESDFQVPERGQAAPDLAVGVVAVAPLGRDRSRVTGRRPPAHARQQLPVHPARDRKAREMEHCGSDVDDGRVTVVDPLDARSGERPQTGATVAAIHAATLARAVLRPGEAPYAAALVAPCRQT